MGRRSYLLGAVFVAMLVVLALLTRDRTSREIRTGSESSSRPSPSAPSVGDSEVKDSREPAKAAEARDLRTLKGIALDSNGGLAGVEVSFTGFESADNNRVEWAEGDWGSLERTTLSTTTDGGGRFSFSDIDESFPNGAVVWATRSDHLAGCALLPPARDQWPAEVRITVDRARESEVLVLDTEGRPANGARIDQFGVNPSREATRHDEMTEERSRRLLHRVTTTGADGTARISSFPGEEVLVASRQNEQSAPWKGKSREHVTLRLSPTFKIGGRVVLPSWDHADEPREQRITIVAMEKNLARRLHTIRGVRNGPWGPLELPILDAERYRVRLEGAPIVPVETFFEPPRPGDVLTRELVAELGTGLWLQVVDEEDHVIPGATVKVQWQDQADPNHWNFTERRSGREERVRISGIPAAAAMMFEASAPGYVTRRSSLATISSSGEDYYKLVLGKATRVHGYCLHEGKPVEDFEVITWQTSNREGYLSTSFFDREDGEFELDTVPLGDSWITACSARLPGCAPKQIRTSAEGSTEVVLELPVPLSGVGQLVDETTNEPVPGAAIQLFIPGDLAPIASWGEPIRVGSDGVFDVQGFHEGENSLRVMAPGYARKIVKKPAAAGEAMDWGTIPLSKSHELTIVLEDTTGKNDFAGIRVAGQGEQVLPTRDFSPDGIAEFSEVSAGLYQLELAGRDGEQTFLVVDLRPGSVWRIEHRIAGSNLLTLEILTDDPSKLPTLGAAWVHYQSRRGIQVHRALGPILQPIVEVDGIDADAAEVEFVDFQNVPLATASGSFVGGRLHLSLSLEGKPFVLHVVDPEGRPMSDVRVVVRDPSHPEVFHLGATDEAGECELPGVPEREVLVDLRHARGSHFGIPMDATAGHAELVLDPRARLAVVFQDGELRLPGVSCSLVDETGKSLQLSAQSDGAGIALFDGLGPGTYYLRASRNDCWPVEFTAEARIDASPRPVQMRRLADLELDIRASNGLPVSGLTVELTSVEFATDVADWITSGRVRSSGLTTDRRGRIRVERLPRGPYRWRIVPPGAEVLEGEHEVEPEADRPLALVLR